MGEMKTFREKKLPCDLTIYLGTGFCPSGWNTGHGSFTFNKTAFPDPKEMIKEMHDEHFKIAVHVVIQQKDVHGTVRDTGAAADSTEDVANYWAKHLEVFRMGMDAWWPDEGDWLSPKACLVRNRMYWEGPQKDRPNVRPYALHRNGNAGMQRYGWLWSGDIDSTWETFTAQVPVGINTSLSGMPFWGTDTGGFVTTPEFTGELYARWFQFSAFCPLFRSHGRTWKLRLPWGWNTGDYGPKELGGYTGKAGLPDPKELHNPEIEPICRKYLELRYRLLPYLYSAVREAHDTGMPIMRALWLHYPDDSAAVARSDEYLWGRDILVAPVTEKGATSRQLYLPRGTWYDFWTETKTEGGRELKRPVDLATLPLYVRAGAIIPMGPIKQYTTEKVDEPVTLTIYPGADGEYELYEDDGVSYDFEKGQSSRIRFEWNDHESQLSISLAPDSRLTGQGNREFLVRKASESAQHKVSFTGKPANIRL
jgi:alpha-glucosidase/alpha-D-xyloside xylohydrolase